MSRAYFTWQEAILRSTLEPTTKLVCHTIGCHMAADGSGCFPSYQTIADESGLNRSTVIRHVAKATDAGFLKVTGRRDQDGDQTSNLYRPIMPTGVVAQEDHPVAQGDQGGGVRRPRVVAQGDPNHPSELPNKQTLCAFEKFWEAYPNKVGGKVCEHKWRSRKLDANLDFILAGLERWKASDRWKRGYVLDPLTFLNQERWKDIPPAAIGSKSGELRVRETTDAEKRDAKLNRFYLEYIKAGKPEAEAARLAQEEFVNENRSKADQHP